MRVISSQLDTQTLRAVRMREGAVNPPASVGEYTDSFVVKIRVQDEDFLRNTVCGSLLIE